jgi:hypothetical protein
MATIGWGSRQERKTTKRHPLSLLQHKQKQGLKSHNATCGPPGSDIFYDELKHVNHSIDFLLKGETISFFPEPPVHKNGDGIEIIPPKN